MFAQMQRPTTGVTIMCDSIVHELFLVVAQYDERDHRKFCFGTHPFVIMHCNPHGAHSDMDSHISFHIQIQASYPCSLFVLMSFFPRRTDITAFRRHDAIG